MAAVAKRESDPEAFVGQVFARSSPILTWRPALAKRVADEAAADEISAYSVVDPHESSVCRISRAATRRMVAWPVIAHVRRVHRASMWTIVRRCAIAFVVAAALVALGVAEYAWQARGVARVMPPVARVVSVHVIDHGFDVLVPAAPASTVAAVASPAPRAAQSVASSKAPAPANPAPARGRAHHGHRHGTSATR